MNIVHDLFHVEIPILEKVLRPILVYFFLVAALRLAGKRELAQINTFDLVVLLTLSNTVQNAIIGSDNSLLGGVIGAVTLLGLNAVVVHFLYGHPLITRLFEGSPTLLLEKGSVSEDALKSEGITPVELAEAAHRQGFASLAEVETATLEPSGMISFIAHKPTEETIRHNEVMERLDQLAQEMATLRATLL
jgi:uncharacterized membrane protein YcaP (DUF421 family)